MTTDLRRDADARESVDETIDETIDRVAATMTAVPGDPEFASRLAGQLHPRRAPWLEPRGFVVAALAVGVVVLAVSLTVRRLEPVPTAVPRVANGPEAPGVMASAPAAVSGDATPTARVARDDRPRVRPRRGDTSNELGVPQIAALAAPAALVVIELDTHVLTIRPVEVAPLDLAHLTFSDLDSPDHPKE